MEVPTTTQHKNLRFLTPALIAQHICPTQTSVTRKTKPWTHSTSHVKRVSRTTPYNWHLVRDSIFQQQVQKHERLTKVQNAYLESVNGKKHTTYKTLLVRPRDFYGGHRKKGFVTYTKQQSRTMLVNILICATVKDSDYEILLWSQKRKHKCLPASGITKVHSKHITQTQNAFGAWNSKGLWYPTSRTPRSNLHRGNC